MPLAEAAARCTEGGFVWLGLFEPEKELAQVRDTFGLHELAVEDAQNFHMRPKIESYDRDVRLVILRTARYDDAAEEVQFGEISVSPRAGLRDHGAAGRGQRAARRPAAAGAAAGAPGRGQLLGVVGDLGPGGRRLRTGGRRARARYRAVEPTVFSGAVAPTERIYLLRREVTDFYRAVHPLLAVVATIERARPNSCRPYLHDVHDHLQLVNEEVAAQRDLLSTVLEANIAVISVEQTKISVLQNSTIEQLTKLSTVFLPLTFVTGFFGQNFGWLVGHLDGFAAFAVYGIGGLVVPLALLFAWLRSRAPHARTAAAPDGT